MSVPTIARTELYGAKPSLALIEQMATALEVEITDLLADDEQGAA